MIRKLLRKAMVRFLWMVSPSPRVITGPSYDRWEQGDAAGARGSSYLGSDLNVELIKDQRRLMAHGDSSFASRRLAGLIGLALGRCRWQDGARLNVLDFGGSVGAHYWEAVCVFGPIFNWVVVETEAAAAAARQLGHDQPPLVSSITEARAILGSIDICLISGSLQYCPDPAAMIRELSDLDAQIYLLRRTPRLIDLQSGLAGKYWVQRAKWLHHLLAPKLTPHLLRRTAFPVTFLTANMLAGFATGRKEIFAASEGPMYLLPAQGEQVEGITRMWARDRV